MCPHVLEALSNEGCCSLGLHFSCLCLGSAYNADTLATVSGIADRARKWKVGDDVMNEELQGAWASSQSRSSHGEDIGPAVNQYEDRPSSGWVVLESVSLEFQSLPHIKEGPYQDRPPLCPFRL